jgi:hypothetical protein
VPASACRTTAIASDGASARPQRQVVGRHQHLLGASPSWRDTTSSVSIEVPSTPVWQASRRRP